MHRILQENVKNFKRFVSLEQFEGKNIVYLAHVFGDNEHEEEDCEFVKFGESSGVYRREKDHKKDFEHFDYFYIVECRNSKRIEGLFEKYLKDEKILTTFLNKRNKKATEIFKVKDEETLENALQELNRLAQQEKKNEDDIMDIKHRLEISEFKRQMVEKDLEIALLKLELLKAKSGLNIQV